MASKRWRRSVLVAVLLVALAVAIWAIPGSRARVKALGVVTATTGIPFPRPWAASVEVAATEVAPGVIGDIYNGGADAPVILFVPGATREGRDDPRVVDAATAFARAGRRVFVPELALYDRTFRRGDIDRLAAAIDALSDEGGVGVLGFSYGGSFALIAAADPATTGDISYVATFGAYFQLANVIEGITTGSTILDGDNVPFETVPEARTILTSAAVRLAPAPQRDELEHALETQDPTDLSPRSRVVYDLLTNRDPDDSSALLAALPDRLKDTLDQFSPSSHVDRIRVPVFIMQSKKDAATPWTEAVLLERSLRRTRLVMLDHFSHLDPPGIRGWVFDGPKAWWFTSWVLAAQE